MQTVVMVLSWNVFVVFTNNAVPVCAPEITSEIEEKIM